MSVKKRWVDSLLALELAPSLHGAARWAVHGLDPGLREYRAQYLAASGAHVRGVRLALEAEHGITSQRKADWPDDRTDDELAWAVVMYIALVARTPDAPGLAPYFLRNAEAALRTLWRRGQA